MDLRKQWVKVMAVLFFVICGIFSATPSLLHSAITSQTDNEFPLYPSMKPNVDFWIDIFSKYSRAHGVIHDARKLWIIYEVVSLDPSESVSAGEKNQKIRKEAVDRYKEILLKLSFGSSPRSKEENRVAALFGPKATASDFEEAASHIRCQTGISKDFREGLIRSGAVIDEFKRIFKSHGLPVDLVYLPCVESSFNFKAYSKFGAAGVWQFMYTTGKMYMEIDYVVDERRDPFISADAAARLLKKNHSLLGDWPLAITAYNHGLNGMLRAKNAAGNYENIFKTYTTSTFRFASRNFYPEFIAARMIAKNHEKYFGRLEFDKPLVFQTVKTKGYLAVKDLAAGFNLSVQDIQTLNPSLRPPVFNEQKFIPKGFNLKLPQTIPVNHINAKLAGIYKNTQNPSKFHKVQKGDTASSIARRHSIRIEDLIGANGLNKKAAIFIGQNLRIPVKGEIITAKKEPVKAKAPKPVREKTPVDVKTAAAPVPEPFSEPRTEQVLDLVAKPVQEDTAINPHIVTSDLKIRQIENKAGFAMGIIRVEAEETLGHYAGWLKVSTRELRELNGIKTGKPVSIDQKIKIPLKKVAAREFEEQRYEFHKEIEEDFFGSFSIQGVDVYEIKEGDNIWRLCSNELEVPFWLVKKYNPEIDFNLLQLRQKIKYPVVGKRKENGSQNGF